MSKKLVIFLSFILVLAACGPVTPLPPTATPESTQTPRIKSPIPSWPGMQPGWSVFWPSPYLNDVIYDPSGYLWARTNQQLLRWEIKSGKMQTFTTADGLPPNINQFVAFDGKLWFTTAKGEVGSFDDKIGELKKVSDKIIYSFSRTAERLWGYGEGNSVYFYENGRWQEFKDIPDNECYRVVGHSKDGSLWFRGYSGVARFDGKTWKKYDNLSDAVEILASPDGVVYFVFNQIVLLFDGETFKPVILPNERYVYNIEYRFQMPDGSLWIKTYRDKEEAYIIHPDSSVEQVAFQPLPTPENPADPYFIRAYTLDGLLLASSDTIALYKDGKLKIFTAQAKSELAELVHQGDAIGFAPDGALWIAGNHRLIRYDGIQAEQPFAEYDDSVFSGMPIKIDSQGAIWVLDSVLNRLLKFKFGEKEPRIYPLTLAINDFDLAPDGTLWMAGRYGYLAYMDPDASDEGLANPEYISIGNGSIKKTLIARRLLVGPDGKVWVFVSGVGLYRYDDSQWEYYGMNDMREDGTAFAVNSRGEVWAGYNYYLFKHNGQAWNTYPRNCIFPSHLTIAPDDSVWFVNGCDGVYRFDEKEWTHFTREKEMAGTVPSKILVAPDGALWFFSWDAWIRYMP